MRAETLRWFGAGVFATLAGGALAASPTTAAEAMPPDPELIEFLGSFTTDDGEWIDPEALAAAELEEPDTRPELHENAAPEVRGGEADHD